MIDFAPLAWVYFTVWAVCAVPAFLSLRPGAAFGALIMGASWLSSNEAVRQFGYPGFILPTALGDGVLAVLTAGVGSLARSRALAIVFALFVAEEVCHMAFVGAIRLKNVTPSEMSWYVLLLNLVFVAQCLAVGIAGVGTRLVDRFSPDNRPRPHPGRGGLGVAKADVARKA